ncbi:minor capsid protein [Listeria monocytogenes]|nr:minor capsid protein [Listeria monocytogenes]EAC9929968.1 minor capsid protein [Listeria monocytogenes]EAC9933039.1 minor capsid protein [Listeria monocytogenes]EAC9936123.1 minor capsid protein [Listeria monocytogenes]EAC9939242.1 minor capsid protein [Listeria monocytogenes]
MALTPRQLDLFVQPVVDVYTTLENELFTLIVRRLKTKKNISADNVLAWQIEKLNQVHALDQQMIERISKASGVSAKKLFSIVKDAGYSDLTQVDNYFSKLAETGAVLPLVSDGQTIVDKVMRSYFKLAQSNYNRVNQTMLSQARQIYSDIIHETTQSVLAGLKTHRQALAETVTKFAENGVPALVDKANKRWTPEAYVRTVTRTTVNSVYNSVEDERMNEYGVDLVRISQHVGARPTCSIFQGKVICLLSVEETKTKYGNKYMSIYSPELRYGYGDGIFGCNCRHHRFAFVEGINIAPGENELIDEEENKRVYMLSQQQRLMERDIRAAKRKLSAAEELGDELTVKKAKQAVRTKQSKLRAFVKTHNLTRQYSREKVYA